MAASPPTPMFPLQSALLPGETLPLRIFEARYVRLFRDCLDASEPSFGVVLISRGREVGGGDVRTDVGTLARIVQYAAMPQGHYQVLAEITERLRVVHWLADDPYPRAVTAPWPDEPGPAVPPERIADVVDAVTALYQQVADASGGQLRPDALAVDPEVADDAARHVYALAARVPMGQADRHAVLAAPTLAQRVETLLDSIETVTAMVRFRLSDE